MELLKISYTIWRKHGDNLYCRVRQANVKPLDVNLHTNDQAKAEAFVKLRKQELEIYNSYILAGESVPADIANKLLRRGSTVSQKGASGPVSLLTTAMDGWEQDMRLRGKRQATIDTYEKQVRIVVPAGATTADFTTENVHAWLTQFSDKKTATKKAYSVSLREFGKYLVRHHGVDSAILDNWPMTKVFQEEKSYWTLTQMYHIIEAIQCKDKDAEEQMKVYCWIMATCGSRQGETAELCWSDIKGNVLTFRAENTKSNVTRRVPLDPRVAEMIYRLPKKSSRIFPDIPKQQAGRYACVAKAVRKSNMPHGGLHSFRHSACMHLYAKSNDIKAVAQLVGHSESVSLKFYQASRQAEELRGLVESAYKDETMIPSVTDELIKAGLW